MHITIKSLDQYPQALIADIDSWYKRVFDSSAEAADQWARPGWRLVVWEGDQWVSVLELLDRTIMVGGQPVRVGGVGGVMTLPDQRGRGYASVAMKRAVEFLGDEWQVPYSLLICLPVLNPFYAALGWEPVDAPAYYDRSGHKQPFVYYTSMMVYRHNGNPWPPGEIDLCGPPW